MEIILATMERLDKKLDVIQEDVTSLKVDSAKNTLNIDRNTVDLATHIERTNLLQDIVNGHQAHCETVHRPLSFKRVAKWTAGAITFMATIAGAVVGIIRLLKP